MSQLSLPAPRQARELANLLGWFSIGLGALELFAGHSVARWLGVPKSESVVRAYGVRELATGAAILTSQDPTPWIWGRVVGDALDLATLGAALDRSEAKRNVALAFGAVGGVTVLDVVCAQWLQQRPPPARLRRFRDRSGFPRGVAQSWGAAHDFVVPEDFRTPKLLRPFGTA